MSRPDDPNNEKERICAYLIYPFDHPEFNSTVKIKATIKTLYYRGYAVVVPPVVMVSSGFWSFDLSIIKSIIQTCPVSLLCYDVHCTERMLQEIVYAKAAGKPVIRMTFPKLGGE